MQANSRGILLSKSQIKKILRLVSLIIAITLLASILYFYQYNKFDHFKQDQTIKSLNVSIEMNRFPFKINMNDPFASIFRKAISNSFNEYYQNCAGYDEYRPDTRTCLNEFGFSSTMFESLEILYLFGLQEQYEKARNFIMNNFSIHNTQWINRREFWSRCIGSLLSCFILTSDKLFLLKAVEFSDVLLKFPKRFPYVNIHQNEHREHQWDDAESLTNIVAGLPELFMLSKLTNRQSYSVEYLTILNSIPSTINSNKLFNIIDFYHILSISYPIISMKSIKNILSSFNISRFNFKENSQKCLLFNSNILDTMSLINHHLVDSINHSLYISKYKYSEIFNAFAFQNCCEKYHFVLPFKYDSSNLRAVLMSSSNFEKDRLLALNAINASLSMCHVRENAFSGQIKSNYQKLISNNIQHSNFFGQWMNLAGYLLLDNVSFIKSAVFNERGHLLYYSSISLNDEDE